MELIDTDGLQKHLEEWLTEQPHPTIPCWVMGDHGCGKTTTVTRFLKSQTRFRWERWSAADPGFLDMMRARLQTPRRSVQSFFQQLKPEIVWVDDLEASVHPWRHIAQLVKDAWAKCSSESVPMILSGTSGSQTVLEGVTVHKFKFASPEEPSILLRVAHLLQAPQSVATVDEATMAVYHGHRIFVPLLVLESIYQALCTNPHHPSLHRAMESLYLSDHIDALWRQCSNDELLRLHAWLSVALPHKFMLEAQVQLEEPRFTPYPGRCTARNSLRKHWLEILVACKDPTLRGQSLDDELLHVWSEIKTRGVKKVNTEWKRTNLTAILTNSGSRGRKVISAKKKEDTTSADSDPEESSAMV